MRERAYATRVLVRRKIYETYIGPGFYIAESVSLLLAYFLVAGFVKSVSSAGLNYQLHPLYELIGRSLGGAFGTTFFEKLLAEGPFLLVLYVSLLPILFYLSVSSVFRFGLERKVGAVELVTYGPADGTSYFLASFLKDILFTLIHIAAVIVFISIAAGFNNLVLGSSFFLTLILVFFLSAAIYAFGIFSSVLSKNPASSVIIFIGIMFVFIIVLLGSLTIVSGYVRDLSSVFSWIIKWVSPLFYWNLGLRSMETGSWVLYTLSILLSMALSTGVLAVSHIILKKRGVRA